MLSSVPCSSAIVGKRASESVHLFALREHLLVGHPLHRQVRRVVGDRVVGVALRSTRFQHAFERREPVGEVRVRMEVALDLREGDHVGQFAGERRLDLATILAQRRLDEGQAEMPVDVLLRLGSDQVAGDGVEQPVLVQFQARAHGHLPDPDVVRLGAREIDHRGPPCLERHDAQIHLEPGSGQDGRLRLSPREHPVHETEADEGLHDGLGTVARHEDVDVTDRLRHPSERAGDGGALDLRQRSNRSRSWSATSSASSIRTRPPEVRTRCTPLSTFSSVFLENPLRPASRPSSRGGHQFVQPLDAELLVDDHRLLGPEARDRRHLPDAGGT